MLQRGVNFREMFARILLGPKIRQLESATAAFLDAYSNRSYAMTPEQAVSVLGEVDERFVDLLLRQLKERELGVGVDETIRLSAVRESRGLYIWDVVTQNIIDLWTDYGFGVRVSIEARDEAANEVWKEFFEAPRNAALLNDRSLYTLSTNILTDGEVFFTFYIAQVDGACTLRTVPTEEITEIITDPDDKSIALYYKRTWAGQDAIQHELYYKDWMATAAMLQRAKLPDNAQLADKQRVDEEGKTGTNVVMMQAAHRERSGRGWPLMTAGAAWSRAYKNFLQDRAAVSRAVAMYVDKLGVKGGSRAIDMVKSRLESSLAKISSSGIDTNPPPTAGSTWVENEAITRERLPLGTGAGDAEKDGAPLLAQAGLAGRVFSHYLGRGETYRLATATAMEGPTLRAFNRYQLFWSSIWSDMADIVLTAYEEANSTEFKTHEIDVSTDNIVQLDLKEVNGTLDSIAKLLPLGALDSQVAKLASTELLRTSLSTLGIVDVDSVLNPPTATEAADGLDAASMKEIQQQLDALLLLTERTLDIGSYRDALKAPFYGLWSGKMDITEFQDAMETVVRVGLRDAWEAGAASVGIEADELTDAEIIAMNAAISDEYGYIPGLTQYIDDNSKARGELFNKLDKRLDWWQNRYNDIENRARLMADKQAKLEWILGPTEEHCTDCAKYAGKVKRAAYWEKIGARPQSRSLECKGYECKCKLSATDKPLTRGKLYGPAGG